MRKTERDAFHLIRSSKHALLMLVVALSACGGGGGEGASVPDQPAVPPTRVEAARFLNQATFGATPADIERVVSLGYSGWLDEQFKAQATSHRVNWETADAEIKSADATKSAGQYELFSSFWKGVAAGNDPLRQKVAFELSQIFVISMVDGNVGDNPRGAASYLDMLGDKGFGNYRELLESVSRHPMMGLYLSSLRNQKEDTKTGRIPDQNYAREVMQLFSIGVQQLNADGTVKMSGGTPLESYSYDDVVGMSRVFTGFSWYGPDTDNNRFFGYTGFQDPNRSWMPMQGYNQYHSLLEKKFLGASVPAQSAGAPDASLKTAMDVLYNHSNVGPFIGKQLIQRMVTSNPSPAYVGRVSAAFNDNGAGVRGDMKAVIKAVLLDREARDAAVATSPQFGKIREPLLRWANILRAFGAKSYSGSYKCGSTDDPATQLGQSVLRAPSVFNFYRPGYIAPNTSMGNAGLVAPEMQITNETSTAGYVNFVRDAIANGVGAYDATLRRFDIQLDVSALLPLAGADVPGLVAKVNELLAPGQMSSELVLLVQQGVSSIAVPALKVDGSNKAQVDAALRSRVNTAIFLVAVSPEFIVQK